MRPWPWALVAALAAVVAVRLAGPVSWPGVILAQGVVPLLLLPAYLLVVVAARRRAVALGAAALLLVVTQVWWTVPEVAWRSPTPLPSAAPRVRLVSANLWVDNPDVERLAAEVLARQPDIVSLQELSPSHLDALRAAGFFDAFPYRVVDPHEGPHGSGLFSRLPFADGRVVEVGGYPMTEATIATPLGPLDVVDVHVVAPLSGEGIERWRRQLGELAALRPVAGARLVLAGDFNATLQHRALRAVVGTEGRRDAFLAGGRGLGATWPVAGLPLSGWLPPVLRLDHVVVDRGLEVARVETFGGSGSDHRPLLVDLTSGAAPRR